MDSVKVILGAEYCSMFWVLQALSLTELLRSFASLAVLSLLPGSRSWPNLTTAFFQAFGRVMRSALSSFSPCWPIQFPQLFPILLVSQTPHSASALLWMLSRTLVSFLQCCWSLFLVYPIIVCWYPVMLGSIADYWGLSFADCWLSCRISSIWEAVF